MERGLAAAPGTIPTFNGAVASVEKIRFFGGPVTSGSKLHVSVGHDTVMAQVIAFGVPDGEEDCTVESSTLSQTYSSLHVCGHDPYIELYTDRS